MDLKHAVKSCFRKYATFKGRARRSEFWFFYLFQSLVNMVLTLVVTLVAMGWTLSEVLPLALRVEFTGVDAVGILMSMGGMLLVAFLVMAVFWLALLLPSLAVTWRRLHDTGRSGGKFFIGLIPLVGPILLLIWLCRDSQPEENRFGPNPKEGASSCLSFKEAVGSCFRKYFTFKGRARRSEYWFFVLFLYLVEYALTTLASLLTTMADVAMTADASFAIFSAEFVVLAVIGVLAGLAVFIPTLAVTWRRLHDTGRSGGYFFIGLIPLVGPILLLIWLCRDSQPGENRFGPNLKEPAPWEY